MAIINPRIKLIEILNKKYSCLFLGRLGLGHSYNVSTPRKLPVLSQYVVKKVAVHSGGKHAMALTLDGRVFSWGVYILIQPQKRLRLDFKLMPLFYYNR